MSEEKSPADASRPAASRLASLEWLTAGVLLAVIVALGWIALAAYQPEWLRLPSAELEVVLILVLLATALLLVSVVALLHTRG
jgi:hypothetical protein